MFGILLFFTVFESVMAVGIITLDKNGGTGGLEAIWVYDGIGYAPGTDFSDDRNYGPDDVVICFDCRIGVPTKADYVFGGYYREGHKQIDSDGGTSNAVQTIDQEVYGDETWTAQWTKCEKGYVVNNVCKESSAGKYFDGSTEKDCPVKYGNETLPIGSDKTFVFTTDTDIKTFGIESCAIRLKGVCGEGTKVIYTWNAEENKYVRKSKYKVIAGTQSLIRTDEPGPTVLEDYCESCDSGQYNVNGKCMACGAGLCMNDGGCTFCPAGKYCGENTSLSCNSAPSCGANEYSETGAASCTKCATGYSTTYSGPATENSDFDGLCKDRVNGYGVGCFSADACREIPSQLCFDNSKCGANGTCGSFSIDNSKPYVDQYREQCKASFALSENITIKSYNSSVVSRNDALKNN